MPDFKPQFTSDFQEFEPPHPEADKSAGTTRTLDSVRLGLTVLALLSSITVLGAAADALSVYNQTHLAADFFLALWPTDFDVRPTVAVITCSSIIVLTSIISLLVSKVPSMRNNTTIHKPTSVVAPTVSLIAAVIGTSFFYGVNGSATNHSLQSWTCQWSNISMDVKPHWGTLCRESKLALYLMIVLIPIEVLIMATSAWRVVSESKQARIPQRKGSPAMS